MEANLKGVSICTGTWLTCKKWYLLVPGFCLPVGTWPSQLPKPAPWATSLCALPVSVSLSVHSSVCLTPLLQYSEHIPKLVPVVSSCNSLDGYRLLLAAQHLRLRIRLSWEPLASLLWLFIHLHSAFSLLFILSSWLLQG